MQAFHCHFSTSAGPLPVLPRKPPRQRRPSRRSSRQRTRSRRLPSTGRYDRVAIRRTKDGSETITIKLTETEWKAQSTGDTASGDVDIATEIKITERRIGRRGGESISGHFGGGAAELPAEGGVGTGVWGGILPLLFDNNTSKVSM